MIINQRKAPTPRKKGTTWCGPWAIAVLTARRSYESAETLIRESNGNRFYRTSPFGHENAKMPIKGTFGTDMIRALEAAGYTATLVRGSRVILDERWASKSGRPKTFAAWLRSRDCKATYLVETTGHWGVVSGRKYSDNHTQDWVNTSKATARRAMMGRAWIIEKAGA